MPDVIVRLDCDDTHEPEYIPSIVEKVRSGYDVVIASRFARGGARWELMDTEHLSVVGLICS